MYIWGSQNNTSPVPRSAVKMKIKDFILLVLLIFICIGCQHMTNPTGKDGLFTSKNSSSDYSLRDSYKLSKNELSDLSQKAYAGNSEAAFKIALYYCMFGSRDEEVYWLRLAANNGHVSAQYNLAFILDRTNKKENYQETLYWYKKSAESGDEYAQLALAEIYETGRLVPKDPYQAKTWYEKAAFSGSDTAILKLVDIYFDGIGCEKDLVASYSWLLLAEIKINPNRLNEKKKKLLKILSPSEIKKAEEKFRVLAEKQKMG